MNGLFQWQQYLEKDTLALIQLIQLEVEKKLNVNLCLIDNNESFLDPEEQKKREQLREELHSLAAMISNYTFRDNSCKIQKKFDKSLK